MAFGLLIALFCYPLASQADQATPLIGNSKSVVSVDAGGNVEGITIVDPLGPSRISRKEVNTEGAKKQTNIAQSKYIKTLEGEIVALKAELAAVQKHNSFTRKGKIFHREDVELGRGVALSEDTDVSTEDKDELDVAGAAATEGQESEHFGAAVGRDGNVAMVDAGNVKDKHATLLAHNLGQPSSGGTPARGPPGSGGTPGHGTPEAVKKWKEGLQRAAAGDPGQKSRGRAGARRRWRWQARRPAGARARGEEPGSFAAK